MTRWRVGDRLTHRFNPGIGTGRVTAVEGRTIVVTFPEHGMVLRLAQGSDALERLELTAGTPARLETTGEIVTVAEVLGGDRRRLIDGRTVAEEQLLPLARQRGLVDRLAEGEIDRFDDFSLRLDALRLAELREADGLGPFLGGRVLLFPHQLHVAEQATRADPVRWLLADEVGLGKTVEACLILNLLLRRGRAERVLIVAPTTLTIQWLGELWRKYHRVFVLLDEARLRDITREFGRGFNPFEAYPRMVIALDTLTGSPRLAEHAATAGIDVLIVDEAHHLQRRAGHPGNAEYRAIAPLARTVRHVLLLSATPLEDDALGFFRLVQLLRPDELPDEIDVERRLASGEPLPRCTSATRRAELDGLPDRRPMAIDLPDDAGWQVRAALERAIRSRDASHAVARREMSNRVSRALSSGAALGALVDPRDAPLRPLAELADEQDPRLGWLARKATDWKRDGDKSLVFVAHRETLELLRSEMSRRAQIRTGVFHEDLSPVQRDIEVAQFRLPSGPSMLISTECGGEGRNFQFCRRLVMFDLPWDPAVVEQRIGRLDRIGRNDPVEIIYFRPPGGAGAAVVRLFESIGLFHEPLAGLQPELAHVEAAIRDAVTASAGSIDLRNFDAVVGEARDALGRVRAAAYRELHRDPYRGEMAEQILCRIPADLEELTEEVTVGVCDRLNLALDQLAGARRWAIELGKQALVESLPGVPAGSSFLGTFDRITAVDNESEDFFASGHPLVEAVLAQLDESAAGRIGLLHFSADEPAAFGLVAIYRLGSRLEAQAFDLQGRERPDWAARVLRRPLRSRRVDPESWTSQPGWSAAIRRLAGFLDPAASPVALAALRAG